MDKLNDYRRIIKQLLTERASLMRSQPLLGEEILCLLEEGADNYLLMRLGWVHGERLYSITLHARLLNAKIQVEQDWTDDFISDLMAEGVPREDIVFTFTGPGLHKEADYAAA